MSASSADILGHPHSASGLQGARVLISGLVLLSSFTALKAADVQSAEVFGLFVLVVGLLHVKWSGWIVAGDLQTLRLLRGYILFLAVAMVLGFAALQRPDFPPAAAGLLKRAPMLTFARVCQLAVAVWAFYTVATLIKRRPTLLLLATQLYVLTGLLGSLFGIASWLGLAVGLELGGAYGEDRRVRGFFIEGGPFGMYLVSVMLMCWFRFAVLKKTTRAQFVLQVAVLALAFVLSSSKAGILLLALLVAFSAVVARRWRVLAMGALPIAAIAIAGGLVTNLSGYVGNYVQFEQSIIERPDDTNLMMGRIIGAFLVPRMIADHPVTGIGLGNYSLQRNNPEYLRGLPQTQLWDLHGLGIVGYVAELGVPLSLYLLWLLWKPIRLSAAQPRVVVTALCGFQLFAHLFGVQLTFLYPWLVTAMALGYMQVKHHLESASPGVDSSTTSTAGGH